MTEKVRMIRDIHNFVGGKMDWESALDLIGRASKSEEWIDYLLMDMELYEYFLKMNRKGKDREIFITGNFIVFLTNEHQYSSN